MLRFIVPILILVLIETYAFKGIFVLIKNYSFPVKLSVTILYWGFNIYLFYRFISYMRTSSLIVTKDPEPYVFIMGVVIIFFFAKLFMSSFHLIDDIVYFFKWVVGKLNKPKVEFEGNPMSRSKFITQIGAGVSLLMIGLYTYGVVKGKYSFRVITQKLKFKTLPQEFVGTRIVHVSDFHLGSFANQFDKIQGAIDTINELKPDYIFFTGDMVNNHSNEAEPWIDTFKQLQAKYGKYSIFGNHDYCDYANATKEEKEASVVRLKEIHKEMGFRLMEDEHVLLEKDGAEIALLGTHNWGTGGFHTVGKLENVGTELSDEMFQILLSHDPTQWEAKVMNKRKIDLTLSGHTHGAQMGFEVPSLGIKFSPIKLRYKRWAGLYDSGEDQYIYINRGFGVLGYPGRIGMPPEITLIELGREELA